MTKKLEQEVEKFKSMSRKELAEFFNCKEEEICMGDYIARDTLDTVCPYKVIMGFANFENSDIESLGNLKVVFGFKYLEGDISSPAKYLGINFANSKIKSTEKLEKVYGSINFGNSLITSLGKIKFLGSNLYLNKTNIIDLGDLTEINGILSLDDSKLKSLCKLEKVQKIYANDCILDDFGALKKVKVVQFKKYQIEELKVKIKKLEMSLENLAKEIKKREDAIKAKYTKATIAESYRYEVEIFKKNKFELEKKLLTLKKKYEHISKYCEMENQFNSQFSLRNGTFYRNLEHNV